MKNPRTYVNRLLAGARRARPLLACASTAQKNDALLDMADRLLAHAPALHRENDRDIQLARGARLSDAMIDRLTLTDARIQAVAHALRAIAALPDPVGNIISGWRRPNGLLVRKVRVPIGVILVIFESRPNVTADAAALCLKSSNPVILRGGKEALHSNLAIRRVLADSLEAVRLPQTAIQLVDTPDRAVVGELLTAADRIDLVIPRGGKALISRVVRESSIPVIKHFEGICHIFVDASADVRQALAICLNAKVQRPGVCNAMETLLVHRKIAPRFLPRLAAKMGDAGVQLRACPETRRIIPTARSASAKDWRTEYLDLILNVRIVDDLDQAVEHIAEFGSAHSDAILTRDLDAARRFTRDVDSSAVFVNCSTRFNDGGELGLGAEIGISTDRLHARGPMGLEELTTYKYIVEGDGQIRA